MGLFNFFKHQTVNNTVESKSQETEVGYNLDSEFKPAAKYYKFDTIEQIQRIPVPKTNFECNCDFTQSVEYVLQRKATIYKQDGNLDLAIECLKKATEIMPYSPTLYSDSDYERLENYLKQARRFDEAREVNKKRNSNSATTSYISSLSYFNLVLQEAGAVEVFRNPNVCGDCARFHGRLYDSNAAHGFPNPEIMKKYLEVKRCDCSFAIFPFFYGISIPTDGNMSSLKKRSNRRFIDDRTKAEKIEFEKNIAEFEALSKDRKDYDWIWEFLPEIAPKSFGGYRNMKKRNSKNYQKLVKAAEDKGYKI